MIRFAIRNENGQWRSARWADKFGPWGEAQLWENAKKAKAEIDRWAHNTKMVWLDGTPYNTQRVDDPVRCELVMVTIEEPK